VRGVVVHRAEGVIAHPAGDHEGHRALDLARQLLVLGLDVRVADEHRVPRVHGAQVGEAAVHERPDEVQRGGRHVVDLHQPRRVVGTGRGSEFEAVHRIAAVTRQADPPAGLDVVAARLGVLAGDAAHLHHRHLRGVLQDHGHRQLDAQGVADVGSRYVLERLRTVARLEQERPTDRGGGQSLAQLVALPREDQRRTPAQLVHDGRQRVRVGVRRLLRGTPRVQVGQGRDRCYHRARICQMPRPPGAVRCVRWTPGPGVAGVPRRRPDAAGSGGAPPPRTCRRTSPSCRRRPRRSGRSAPGWPPSPRR